MSLFWVLKVGMSCRRLCAWPRYCCLQLYC